ncbi:hypothetical protein [Bradyrhizobium sp. 172]|uniref:hypothetical protein n=1 Tax=Bradyrhizobium sp. 172 TaxID=2782643 RepID=UPI001FFF0DED|nr:hypothetical protein [Bradyrhizobium sp. 172]UPJ94928.1 hypothetical protein IVB07_31855 [Bradyrhizobium sp. 172]
MRHSADILEDQRITEHMAIIDAIRQATPNSFWTRYPITPNCSGVVSVLQAAQ